MKEILASELDVGDKFYIIWGKFVDHELHEVSEKDGMSIKTLDGFSLTFGSSSVVGVEDTEG